MPTSDAYRSARCLLGLTQHQVGKLMGIRRETVGRMESIYQSEPKGWTAYLRYYNVWLREYARLRQPQNLFAVDAILDSNTTITKWLGEQEEPMGARHGRAHPNRIVELDKTFTSLMATAEYLIEHGYADGSPRTVQVKLSQLLNRYVKRETLYGFHFEDLSQEKESAHGTSKRI